MRCLGLQTNTPVRLDEVYRAAADMQGLTGRRTGKPMLHPFCILSAFFLAFFLHPFCIDGLADVREGY